MKHYSTTLTTLFFFNLLLLFIIQFNVSESKMKTYEDLAEIIKNASTTGVRDFEEEI